MAKDRQRRRKGNAGNPARSRARDMGLDDPTIDESGLTDPVPAPDPLKNASPEVDQAKAAETGAGRGGPGEEIEAEDDFYGEDFERAPDQLEETMPATTGPVDPAVAAERRPATHKERGKVLTFLRHCIEELRRVQWPDRKHVFQATAVVLGFCLLAGGYLGLMDAIWQPVVDAIL